MRILVLDVGGTHVKALVLSGPDADGPIGDPDGGHARTHDTPGRHAPAETPAAGVRIAEAAPARTPPGEAVLKGEPVDVGTGHLLLPAVDVELPGALPLVLERLHRSSYRSGRFFGPTWASTLDQHLQITDDDVVLARLDGVDFRAHCPHGRPLLLRMATGEIARRFGRS